MLQLGRGTGDYCYKNVEIFRHNRKLRIFQSLHRLRSWRGQKISEKASGLCLFSWCFHSLCPRLGNTGKYCTVQKTNSKKLSTREKNPSQQFVIPIISPTVLWITLSSLLSHRVPQRDTFSTRCVDCVTDAHPFCCISLCVFKQPEHTSVVTEIATIIKHHQPHRFYLFIFLLNFFFY